MEELIVSNIKVKVIKDDNNIPVPQFLDEKTSTPKQHLGNHAPYQQLVDADGVPIGKNNPLPVRLESLEIDLGTFDPE